MREFLIAIIVSLLVVIAGLSHALIRHGQSGSRVEAQPSLVTELQPSAGTEKRKPAEDREGDEFWPPLWGYRLKVTDTLVAGFTALLFIATLALYQATRNLVLGADRTAERQLRAYVYVEKTHLNYEKGHWEHSYRIKNFGQTPAHKVRLASRTEAVDWKSGRPVLPKPTQVEELGSMAPNGDFFDNENKVYGAATEAELVKGSKAIYLVGSIRYQTVFGDLEHVTNFRYYVGGDMEYSSGEMSADDEGNDAT